MRLRNAQLHTGVTRPLSTRRNKSRLHSAACRRGWPSLDTGPPLVLRQARDEGQFDLLDPCGSLHEAINPHPELVEGWGRTKREKLIQHFEKFFPARSRKISRQVLDNFAATNFFRNFFRKK